MSFDTLRKSLPNGLHDAILDVLHIDYQRAEAAMDVQVDVGSPTTGSESYRRARLIFDGTHFVIMDAPTNGSSGIISTIDMGEGQPVTAPIPLPRLDDDTQLVWIFLHASNSFIRIAARNVRFQWLDDVGPPVNMD